MSISRKIADNSKLLKRSKTRLFPLNPLKPDAAAIAIVILLALIACAFLLAKMLFQISWVTQIYVSESTAYYSSNPPDIEKVLFQYNELSKTYPKNGPPDLSIQEAQVKLWSDYSKSRHETLMNIGAAEISKNSILIASLSIIAVLFIEIIRFFMDFQRARVYPVFSVKSISNSLAISMKHKSEIPVVLIFKEEIIDCSGLKEKRGISKHRYLEEKETANGVFMYDFHLKVKANQKLRLTVYTMRICDSFAFTKQVVFEDEVKQTSKTLFDIFKFNCFRFSH